MHTHNILCICDKRTTNSFSILDRHPGLLALWGDDRSQEMEMIRWRLFVHAVSPRLNPEEVMNLPEHLVIPVAALFYIEVSQLCSKQWFSF